MPKAPLKEFKKSVEAIKIQQLETILNAVCARCRKSIDGQNQYARGRFIYGECCIGKVREEAEKEIR